MTAQIIIGVIILLTILSIIFIKRRANEMRKVVEILLEYRPKVAAAKTSDELEAIKRDLVENNNIRKLIFYNEMETFWNSIEDKIFKLAENERKAKNDGTRSI